MIHLPQATFPKPRLLPCPFCGPRPEPGGAPSVRALQDPHLPYSFYVACPWCLSRGPVAHDDASAAEAWNNRAAVAT